ncbi:MAG: SGNH/GDSL hydrolase family protein [Cytophagales bacterium]|nr:SGNH/GDSL hydrolase family protein [Cytophagales bacterium]
MKKIREIITIVFIAFFCNVFAQNNLIPADNENISYMGRIDFTNEKYPSYSYPGITISTRFQGTSIQAVIKDFGLGGTTTTNYYNVIVDGELLHKIEVNKQDTLYTLATGLTDQEHTIEIVKRTESSVGKSSFGGFVIEGNELLPVQLPTLKMEFIGDSWTCGYGNDISTTSPNTGFHSINEDNYKAWGYTLAKRFNAQYHCTAVSGRGLYRNNTGTTNGTLPQEWNYIHAGNTTWDHSSYIPDIVFINLGTNDFFLETVSNPIDVDSAKYVSAYIDFIEDIREKYNATTKIVCVFGNSKSDYWPEGKQHLTRLRTYTNEVVNHFNLEGDTNVYVFEQKTQDSPYGEDWHPTTHSHNLMAKEISSFVGELLSVEYSDYLPETSPAYFYIQSIWDNKEKVSTSLNAFPNPCTTTTYITSFTNDEEWQLVNVLGEVVFNGVGQLIDLNAVGSGTYFVVTNKSRTKVSKR